MTLHRLVQAIFASHGFTASIAVLLWLGTCLPLRAVDGPLRRTAAPAVLSPEIEENEPEKFSEEASGEELAEEPSTTDEIPGAPRVPVKSVLHSDPADAFGVRPNSSSEYAPYLEPPLAAEGYPEPLTGHSPAEPLSESPDATPQRTGGGGGGFGGMGGGPGGGGTPGLNATWFPEQALSGTPYSIGLTKAGIRVGAPLWRKGSTMLMLTTSAHETWFSKSASSGAAPLLLPNTGLEFPDQVVNVSLGTMLISKFDNGWTGSVGFNVGSASDEPFHSTRELTFGANGMLLIPRDRNAWMLSLFYAPTSQLWFPIPGVAYRWSPSDELAVTVGLPLSIRWKPFENWQLDATYIPVTNFNAKITRNLGERAALYAGYFAVNESYLLADRVEYRDRFMIFEQRVATGLLLPLAKHLSADLSGGYAFGRYFSEGQNVLGQSGNRLNLGSGPYVGLQVQMRF